MNIRFFRITLTTCVVMLGTNSTLAADTKIISPQTTASQPQAKRMSEASSKPKIKLIDINSAKKAEIKTLPGVGDSEADKIIAGRPYGSKAHLLTLNVVSAEVYEGLKGLVIAKQPTNDAAKNAALYKNKK